MDFDFFLNICATQKEQIRHQLQTKHDSTQHKAAGEFKALGNGYACYKLMQAIRNPAARSSPHTPKSQARSDDGQRASERARPGPSTYIASASEASEGRGAALKMPTAFRLLSRRGPRTHVPPPIAVLEPSPIMGSTQPATQAMSTSRSYEDLPSAREAVFTTATVPQARNTGHDPNKSVDLDDVLDLYLSSGPKVSDGEDDYKSFIDGTPYIALGFSGRSSLDSEGCTAATTASRKLQEASGPVPGPSDTVQSSGVLRDRYGFMCESQFVHLEPYSAWSTEYDQILLRRRKKWDALLSESGLTPAEGTPVHFPPRSTKVQRYIRKGIPPEYRGHAWFFYSNGHRRLKEHPGLYAKLAADASKLDDNNAELIERDLHRTFPDNIYFKPEGYVKPATTPKRPLVSGLAEPPIITSLRRVLQAFALYRPKAGYCQSLNFIAGIFLLFLSEEKSFWMLIVVTTEFLPNVHDANLEGANVDQAVLMLSIKESLPAIWSKMGSGNDIMSPGSDVSTNVVLQVNELVTKLPPITLVTAAWFMSAFTGILPIETTLRVWDCFFYEGSKTLFRIALTILKLGEPRILSVQEPMEIFQVVQNLPKTLLDPALLMEACFKRRNGFGHLSQKDIDTRREKVGKIRAEMMKQRQSRDDSAVQLGSRQTSSRSIRNGFRKAS